MAALEPCPTGLDTQVQGLLTLYPLMLSQTGAAPESFATLITLVGFLTSMNPLVTDEAKDVPAKFLTLVTPIGLLWGLMR